MPRSDTAPQTAPICTVLLAVVVLCSVPRVAHGQAAAGVEPAPAAAADAASAPTAGREPRPSRDNPTQLAPVEVRSSNTDDTQLRRQSTAAKITIGRDEIERFGDSTVGDLLKRLPGVTMQGRPGRGGNVRMRGLGSGYTQILLDGERVPQGFSIDSLSPEQIERIEIQRAPTAETGARAIAGTINIITREGFSKKLNDLRISAAVENDALQPGLSWTRNDALDGVSYNTSLSLFRNDRRSDSVTNTELFNVATNTLEVAQHDVGVVREVRQGLHLTSRLQWRGEAGQTATLMPLVIYSAGDSRRDGRLENLGASTPNPYDVAHTDTDSSFQLLRLNGNWTQRLDEGGRFELRGGAGQARFRSHSFRSEAGGATPHNYLEDIDNVERSVNMTGKWTQLLGDGEHTVVSGAELEANRRTEGRTTLQDGTSQAALADFGDNLAAHSDRVAVYAQDEWSLGPQWSAHAGLRWEGIVTQGSGAASEPGETNRSSVWSPLLHLLWKPDPTGRDQWRLSLTRSYRSPSLSNLIAKPGINKCCTPPGTANDRLRPDRAGNAGLKPELATGIDLAFEHYLPASGLLSANLFQRWITDYMRTVTSLETDPWSLGQDRYVARMQNVGKAVTRGIELEAKFRLSALLETAPNVDLRANASVFSSKVEGVPSPDNRIDQQPDWTANLGADYRLPGTPFLIGGSANFTPGYTTRIDSEQTARINSKLVLDAYGLWSVSPTFQVRLSASNLAVRDYVTGGFFNSATSRETTQTVAPTYLNVQLRLEFKL